VIKNECLEQQCPFIYNEVIVNNCYNVLKEEIENNIVVDIGANRGFFSILCARMNAYKIHSFEPNKKNYDLMVDNCRDIDNIVAYNLGVFDKKTKKMTITDDDFCSNLFSMILFNGQWTSIDDIHEEIYSDGVLYSPSNQECKLIGLDNIVDNFNNENKDIVIKIDCEGSEYEILFDTSYENFQKIKIIYIEIHNRINTDLNSQMLFGLLKYVGFEKVFENIIDGSIICKFQRIKKGG